MYVLLKAILAVIKDLFPLPNMKASDIFWEAKIWSANIIKALTLHENMHVCDCKVFFKHRCLSCNQVICESETINVLKVKTFDRHEPFDIHSYVMSFVEKK